MSNDQKRWETPDMTSYGSVEELTAKRFGSSDGIKVNGEDVGS